MNQATAYANANIALVKYWGKRDHPLNIPCVSSLSMTLNDFGTTVSLSWSTSGAHETLIDGARVHAHVAMRTARYLEQLRALYPFDGFFVVSSTSNVPIASGLASSASFYAALATALNKILDLRLTVRDCSKLARVGSASAARSLFSRFAVLHGGLHCDHHDAYADSTIAHQNLDLAMVIAVVSDQPKPISSREAMVQSKATSPFFDAFVATQPKDFARAITALRDGSLETLGTIMEHSTLKMFSTMWTAQPAINYWHPHTIALINAVYELRLMLGPVVYFTMDAGPNVKILCSQTVLPDVVRFIAQKSLTQHLYVVTPGQGAYVMDAS